VLHFCSDGVIMTELLTTISKVVAVLSFSVLWLGFSYEYGFFYLIGRPLQGLMNSKDYIGSAVLWLPATAVAMAAGVGFHFVLRRMEKFRSEAEIRTIYRTPLRAWIARDLPNTLVYWMIVLVGLSNLFFGNPYAASLTPFAFAVIWFTFCTWFFGHDALKDFSKVATAFIFFAPVVTMIAFWNGISEGYRALSQVDKVYLLKLENDDTEKKLQLLRSFDRGVLFRDPVSSKIIFYNWDTVSAFSLAVQVPIEETLFCKLTGYDCKFIPRYP
jgi:hypothetical protein